jgi:hypothetical protein
MNRQDAKGIQVKKWTWADRSMRVGRRVRSELEASILLG